MKNLERIFLLVLISFLHSPVIQAKAPILTSHTYTSKRITTHYWEAGPANGPLMIFVHGWPEIGLAWRAQMEALASEGWRCIAPDLRGFGNSSVPTAKGAYAIKEIVNDMVELHSHLGGQRAIWVGHDWGSPVVSSLVAHYPKMSRGVVLVSVPYLPNGWALLNLIPFVDRKLYPASKYPDGQWDYWRFYLTHFDQAVSDMDTDVPATLASIFTKGNPSSVGKLSPSAMVTAKGGRYGAAHRAPAAKPDPALWPGADFDVLVAAFRKTGFRPCDSYYLNDAANISFAKTAINGGKLSLPVLYINDVYEPFSNINVSKIGDPMRKACPDLTVTDQPSGHWVTLERKAELTRSIRSWIKLKHLK
ncbi:Pimeloyl-ACP methyl ester carboxylesterase [Pedobacter westerhofensis]|uniref:Pimeloyl-ACP methyl ester carboxylesterase n=1 Tax=Pedobacter westerhofensis TaxID=425512 RepID=A0A521BQ01_9SPHI|nr:alpha/beta hydrolase [Pedobacter westerhofensis]SMO49189.1 Pimeloyl-ACP methyl ester carboxylesterase [Pedobacter westerhofensis]